MERKLSVPFTKETAHSLTAGDYVYLSGTIYTARDAAHKRMDAALKEGKQLPFLLKEQTVPLVPPVRRLREEWINIHRNFWTWDWAA